MTLSMALLIALAAWVVTGVTLALLMGRIGFELSGWLIIGLVLGPMAVPIAWWCVRTERRLSPEVLPGAPTVRSGGAGQLRVLVAYDGSDAARAAVRDVQRVLGPELGRMALARVVPFGEASDHEHDVRVELEAARKELAMDVDLLVVHGHPAQALAEEAKAGGFDLIAIGEKGQGRHLFGSAVRELVEASPVPVLVGGQRTRVALPVT